MTERIYAYFPLFLTKTLYDESVSRQKYDVKEIAASIYTNCGEEMKLMLVLRLLIHNVQSLLLLLPKARLIRMERLH